MSSDPELSAIVDQFVERLRTIVEARIRHDVIERVRRALEGEEAFGSRRDSVSKRADGPRERSSPSEKQRVHVQYLARLNRLAEPHREEVRAIARKDGKEAATRRADEILDRSR